MVVQFSETARRLGIWSAVAFIVVGVVSAITLVIGLVSLKSPQDPIADPMLSIHEVLIIVMMPAVVHTRRHPGRKGSGESLTGVSKP